MASQIYKIKNKKFTEKFPEWELIKIGSSHNPEFRFFDIIKGLKEEDYEFEIIPNKNSKTEEYIRLNEGLYKTDVHIIAFHRIKGGGMSYRPNLAIKSIDKGMFEYLKRISDIKTKIGKNWGVSEWLLRPNLDIIQSYKRYENSKSKRVKIRRDIVENCEDFYQYLKLKMRLYFSNIKNKL